MKQYVLDVPAAALPAEPPAADAEARSLRQPGWWRWLLLALLLEPVALAALYLALSGTPTWSQAATSEGIAYVASFSFPREPGAAQAPTQVAEAPVSRISHERGRYVVELHDEALAPALAMLTQATKARVAGSNIFIGSPLRLTRSAVATSPREAWQAVFGDVANFAIACAGNACEVRFVSLVKPGASIPGPASLQGEFSHAELGTAPAQAPVAQAPVVQAPGAQAPVGQPPALSMQGGDTASSEN